MHLTLIGRSTVLLEPGESLDPTDTDAYVVQIIEFAQRNAARRLLYDLKTVRVIDTQYYDWLARLAAACRVANVQLVTVNMRPAAAYALSLRLNSPPPFQCALDVNSARGD